MRKFTLTVMTALLSIGLFAQQASVLNADVSMKAEPNSVQLKSNMAPVIHPATSKAFIYSQGFETAGTGVVGNLPDGWTQYRSTSATDPGSTPLTTASWSRRVDPTYARNGNASMFISYTAQQFTWAVSNEITIPADAEFVLMEFWTWYVNDGGSGYYPTNYHVSILDVAAGTWANPHSMNGSVEPNNVYDSPLYIDLSAYAGKAIKFAFILEYTDGYQFAVDDIIIYAVKDNDFEITEWGVSPDFPLVSGDEITVEALIKNKGVNAGQPNVSLYVNDVLIETIQASVSLENDETEVVSFTYTVPAAGDYAVNVVLEDDDEVDNNSVARNITVFEGVTFSQDFENFDYTDPEDITVIFPPTGWSRTPGANADPLITHSFWNWTSANRITGFNGQVSAIATQNFESPLATLYSEAITLAEVDGKRPSNFKFYTKGINNAVAATAGGPSLGHSTLVVKYATEFPSTNWTELYTFAYDDPMYNGTYIHEVDVKELPYGTYYLSFETSSTFNYTSGATIFRSSVIIDNLLIYNETITSQPTTEGTFNNFNAYPNPFSNQINISNPALISRVVVSNVVGQKVLVVNTNGASQVETSNLAAGLYIVSFEANNGERYVSKMIKK